MNTGATWIDTINRIIPTVGKHIIAQEPLAGGGVGVGIEESAYLGIVITGLQIVELSLRVHYLITQKNTQDCNTISSSV